MATHDFIYPELTNSSLSVDLMFDAALAHNNEVFCSRRKNIYDLHWLRKKRIWKRSSHDHILLDKDQIIFNLKNVNTSKSYSEGFMPLIIILRNCRLTHLLLLMPHDSTLLEPTGL